MHPVTLDEIRARLAAAEERRLGYERQSATPPRRLVKQRYGDTHTFAIHT
jgi:hypothetical protein